MDLPEIVETGNQLIKIGNLPMIQGFVKLTAGVLEQASENTLLSRLQSLLSGDQQSVPAEKIDIEEQIQSGEVVCTPEVEQWISLQPSEVLLFLFSEHRSAVPSLPSCISKYCIRMPRKGRRYGRCSAGWSNPVQGWRS